MLEVGSGGGPSAWIGSTKKGRMIFRVRRGRKRGDKRQDRTVRERKTFHGDCPPVGVSSNGGFWQPGVQSSTVFYPEQGDAPDVIAGQQAIEPEKLIRFPTGGLSQGTLQTVLQFASLGKTIVMATRPFWQTDFAQRKGSRYGGMGRGRLAQDVFLVVRRHRLICKLAHGGQA